MPRMMAGVTPWNGKKNPVTEVATVVTRKIVVQPFIRFAEKQSAKNDQAGNNPNQTQDNIALVNVSTPA